MRGSVKTRLAVVAAALAVVLPAAVALAANTTFKGKGTDDQAVAVQFQRLGGNKPKVTAFTTSNMLYRCSDDSTFRSGVSLGTLKLDVKKSGKFSFSGTADQDGVHFEVKVAGKFKTNKQATGTTTETRSIGAAACSAKEPWKASKKP